MNVGKTNGNISLKSKEIKFSLSYPSFNFLKILSPL